jgi:hypothetical protein
VKDVALIKVWVSMSHCKSEWLVFRGTNQYQLLCEFGKNASDTCAMFSEAYGGEAMKKPSVSEWYK